MPVSITLDNLLYTRLSQQPNGEFTDKFLGKDFSARFIIPGYRQHVRNYYADIIEGSLEQECQKIGMDLPFEHFGMKIKFAKPLEVSLYDTNLHINPGLCQLVDRVGPVVLQNVHLESQVRSYGHRNRFPHLQFHIDRSAQQEARHSMYTRDPFDDEQKHPRTSSTLFIANIVAHLQSLKEGITTRATAENIITTRLIFEKENMEEAIGKVILEQRWDEPEGTGEICMIDNVSVLHASYYRDAQRSGYKIGVRYLTGIAA